MHDLKSLKDILYDKILNYEIIIDNFVDNTTDFVKGSTNLRLNDDL